MTWTNISDQTPSWSPDTDETPIWYEAGELVIDPDFNDSSKWSISNLDAGTWEVSGGKLRLTNFKGNITGDTLKAPIGTKVSYEVVVDSWSQTGLTVVQNQNISTTVGLEVGNESILWVGDATETYFPLTGISSTATVVDISEKLNIAISLATGSLILDRVSIRTANKSDATWTDTSTSSTWTPLTDKTTVWS